MTAWIAPFVSGLEACGYNFGVYVLVKGSLTVTFPHRIKVTHSICIFMLEPPTKAPANYLEVPWLEGNKMLGKKCGLLCVGFLAFCLLVITGCGGGAAAISIAITPSANTVDGADSITLTAAVSSDHNAAGVTWTVSGGGTLSNTTTTSATYTAPAATTSAQTVTITATSVADATKTVTVTVTVAAKPAITTLGTSLSASVGAAYSFQLTGSGGVSPYTWTVTSGTLPPCLSMSTGGLITGSVTAACAGTYSPVFTMTDSGTPTKLTVTTTLNVTIAAAPAIGFIGTVPPTAIYNSVYTGGATASGGAGALTYTLASGALPTGLGLNAASGGITGTPTVTGTFAFSVMAADTFGDSATQGYSITVNPATPTLAFTAIAAHTFGDTPFTVSATSASSGAITYSVTSGPATIAGNTVTITGVGTVALSASQAATTNYAAAAASASFTVNPETPTLTFAAVPAHTFGDAPFTVSATSASSGAVTYSITSGPATVAGNTVTLTGGGTVVLGASQAANGNYGTATGSISFTVNPATTTLTFAVIPTHTYGDPPFGVSATSASSGAVTYSVTSGPATVTGNMVSLTGVGTVVLGASQAATASYTSATATTSFTVNIGVPTLVFAAIPNHAFGDAPFPVNATSASTGTVTYSVTSGPATISGNTVTLTGVGTVVLGASQAATANYTSATASASFMVGTAVPTLTFAAIPTHTYGDAPFAVTATSASTGVVTYSVTSGPATIAGNTVTLTGAGTVVLGASQAATSNYTSATASTSFTVNLATPTLAFTAIPTHTLGDAPFAVSATSASSGAVTYSVTSGPATIAGNTVTLTGSGTVVLGASQAATATYTATTASTSFMVNPALSITTSTTLNSGSVSVLYSQSLGASGGSGAGYSWIVTAGGTQLAALNLSLSTGGVLSGTPASSGSATFTAQVTDSQSHTATGTFSLTVYAGLTVTTTSLPSTNVGVSYSQTLVAAGGTGAGYTWTATSSNLATYGLSLSTAGVITGNPTQSGTASFTANVKDSSNNTAIQALAITIYTALSLPAPDPSSLPSTGYTSVAYSGSISASGGSGNYCWTVTGLPSDGLSGPLPNSSCGYISGSLPISGTPTSTPTTVTFSVKLTDGTTGASVTQTGYSITIGNPTPVSLPTPSSTVPGSATQNQSYNGSITVAGGVPPYTWSINGTTVTGGGLSVGDGLTANANGSSLTISGTPTTITTVNLTNVKVTDSLSSNQTNSYSIAVNTAGSNVSGQIILNNTCGGNVAPPTTTVSLLTNPGGTVVQTQTTDNSGNYTFTSIPNGNYTVSPSISGPSSAFYPASINVTVNNNAIGGQFFQVSLGYTVSGTVSYSGSNTGRIYLQLSNITCGGNGAPGTSIAAPGAFTIRGVPPGAYTLQGWMDLSTLANGSPNTSDPTGTVSGSLTNANVTGVGLTLTDPTITSVPSSNPAIKVITPTDQGVVISFKAVTTNNAETATSYDLQWSTSPTFATSPVTHNFKAVGTHSNVWILSNGTAGVSGSPFSNGTPYYFQVRARNSVGPAASWAVYGGGTPIAVTPGVSTSGIQVQGTVTIPAGITPTGPLYVGLFNQTTNTAYGERIASPVVGANAYSVYVPSDANADYFNFAIIDQNNDGLIDAGDVSNTGSNSNTLAVTAPLTGVNPILPNVNSTAVVTTNYYQNTNSGGSNNAYSLSFDVRGANKLPVAVTLTSGPNINNPIDFAICSTCGNPQYGYYTNIGTIVPTVGDTYNFTVTYSDGSQETGSTVSGQVTAFGSTGAIVGAGDLVANLSPSATSSTSTTPTFTWTYPAGSSTANYVYSFYISDSSGNTIWQIPNNNSNFNGFTYAQDSTGTLTWGTDPLPGDNSVPTGSLNTSTQYTWQIMIQDVNGNSAWTSTWYQP
jgi:hypothetical protein